MSVWKPYSNWVSRFLCLCIFKMSGKAGRSSQSCPSRYLSHERWTLPVEIWDVQIAIASRTTKGSKNSGWSALLFCAYAPTTDLPSPSAWSQIEAIIHQTEFQHSGNGLSQPNFYSSAMLCVNVYGIFAFEELLRFHLSDDLSYLKEYSLQQKWRCHNAKAFPPWAWWSWGTWQLDFPTIS